MNDQPLSPAAIEQVLLELRDWTREGDVLVREFEFPTFRDAIAFMVRVSFEAEQRDHHPEWTNVYTTVSIRLCTHHAGNRLTEKDVALARAIEAVWLGSSP